MPACRTACAPDVTPVVHSVGLIAASKHPLLLLVMMLRLLMMMMRLLLLLLASLRA